MQQLGVTPPVPGTEGWTVRHDLPVPGGATGTPEDNKAFMKTALEAFNSGDVNELRPLVHENLVDHSPMPGQPGGRAGFELRYGMFQSAFTDPVFAMEDQLSEGDLVSSRYTFSGRHTGEIMGMPATGRSFEVPALDMIR